MLQALVLRTTLSQDPVGGFRALAWIPSASLGLLVGWTLLSAGWSDATGRAMIEAQRALLYALVFVLFASVGRRPGDLRWMVRAVAGALLFVSVAGLLTRLLPETFGVDLSLAPDRLSHPLTYWNAQGLVAAAALLLCFHLCSDRAEPVLVRAVAAGGVPLAAVTVLFTFSRSAILAAGAGLIVYLVLTRGGGQLAALLTAGAVTVVALVAAYGADELSSTQPQEAAAVEQGRELAVLLLGLVIASVALRWIVAALGDRAARRVMSVETETRAVRGVWIAALVVTLGVLVAVDVQQRVPDAFDRFFNGPPDIEFGTDLRARLPVAADSGRVDHWKVTLDRFAERPLQGWGAGTYETLWNQDRPDEGRVIDAHTIYFETLAELGIVGGLLLFTPLAAILVAFGIGLRGPPRNRTMHAALVAAAVIWCLHAAGEWDWEMPAASIWLFALGGLATARLRPDGEAAAPRDRSRAWPVAAALACIATAAAPLLLMLSEGRLASAQSALASGDCETAAADALSSIELLSARREPFQVLGFCRALEGFPRQGRDAMVKAVERDPRNWEPRYALGLLKAQAGEDPGADFAEARRLSPREPLIRDVMREMGEVEPAKWPEIAARQQAAALASGRLTIADQ